MHNIERPLSAGLLALSLIISAGNSVAENFASPIGLWQTIDDSTHKPSAIIEISQAADGTLNGKAVKGLLPGDNGRRCSACSDERKDQLIQGMTLVKEMKQNGEGWDGGKILDPNNGTEYKCKMHLIDDGKKLVVRGYIGFSLLGRSQTWIRQE
jgi:uncharacterized protein (DUF2147 family)